MNTKVAIYSGVVPSTTFIENLIDAVASRGCMVYIFGHSKKKSGYENQKAIVLTHPRKNWKLLFFVLYNQALLRMKSGARYKKLDRHIKAKGLSRKMRMILWLKYLPVVMNLPDIFHIQWAKNLDEWMFLKELFGVRIVLSLRGTHIKYSPLANKELAESYFKNFPKVDGFHAVSKDIAVTAARYGAVSQKTRVIYTGINLGEISQIQHEKNYAPVPVLKIISVGRMKWIKGYHMALDALKILKEKGIRFHYTIIAKGDAEELLYQVDDLGLADFITILPGIPQYEVFQKMKESDLLLIPSFDEGIANVALEAMAIGLPVMSSDCGGMSEVVKHNQTGYLFKNRNVIDLSCKVESFRNEPVEKIASVVDNAHQYVYQHHSMEILGRDMTIFYHHLMNPTAKS